MRDRTRVRAIQFGVHLPSLAGAKQVGPNAWKATCPAHDDSRPSMHIRRTDAKGWHWRCFVCAIGGDAIDLVTRRDGLTFLEALNQLDGGKPLPAPPPERETYWRLLVCDCCKNETVKLRDFSHLCDLRDQAACVETWEIAPDFIAAVGPKCLARGMHA